MARGRQHPDGVLVFPTGLFLALYAAGVRNDPSWDDILAAILDFLAGRTAPDLDRVLARASPVVRSDCFWRVVLSQPAVVPALAHDGFFPAVCIPRTLSGALVHTTVGALVAIEADARTTQPHSRARRSAQRPRAVEAPATQELFDAALRRAVLDLGESRIALLCAVGRTDRCHRRSTSGAISPSDS
jgi:hypothetical protein